MKLDDPEDDCIHLKSGQVASSAAATITSEPDKLYNEDLERLVISSQRTKLSTLHLIFLIRPCT